MKKTVKMLDHQKDILKGEHVFHFFGAPAILGAFLEIERNGVVAEQSFREHEL